MDTSECTHKIFLVVPKYYCIRENVHWIKFFLPMRVESDGEIGENCLLMKISMYRTSILLLIFLSFSTLRLTLYSEICRYQRVPLYRQPLSPIATGIPL